tara:strand:+ start:355 stop:1008 length:654 start_codon:yes stop_codon:yes gene_type:complete
MPQPKYIDGAREWQEQRGMTIGSQKDGSDFVEIKYRGPSQSALKWRQGWPKGTACPEKGFGHLTLIHAPVIREEAAAFSTATLRFEGLSLTSKHEDQVVSEITYSFSASNNSFAINFWGHESWYSYFARTMTARYTSTEKPADTNLKGRARAAEMLDPVPLKKESGNGPAAAGLKKGDWKVTPADTSKWIGAFAYDETAGVYTVTETWSKYLEAANE